MFWSRLGRLLLAAAALAAVVVGAGVGWTATAALGRAVDDVSRLVSDFRSE
jgi:hypothetical protein